MDEKVTNRIKVDMFTVEEVAEFVKGYILQSWDEDNTTMDISLRPTGNSEYQVKIHCTQVST